jgi:hypothetical protein
MSWFDDLLDIGKSALTWYTGSTIGAQIARTVVTGVALNQVNKAIAKEQKKDQQTQADQGVKLKVDPDPNAKIPVVYGRSILSGIVTDAAITNSNQTMWYCITLCEVTGNLNLGQGAASQINFINVYRDNQKLIFASDGITVSKAVSADGVENTDINGLVKVYLFRNGSNSGPSPQAATNLMPNWTANHAMTNLAFALVRVDYNREKNVTGLGTFKFALQNTMTQPGDCLYDYMTNTRYGAGIDPGEIYAQ